jgi:hypothetical protein
MKKALDRHLFQTRVARWPILKPKIPIWVNFVGFVTEDVGIFYGHLDYSRDIWYIL